MIKSTDNTPKKKNRLWIAALIITVIGILFSFALRSGFFDKILSVLEPIFIGLVLAYLLNPLVKLMEKGFFNLCGKRAKKVKRMHKFCLALSIFFAMVFAVGLITLCVYLIVPQLYETIEGLVKKLPNMIEDTIKWYNQLVQGNDTIHSVEKYVLDSVKNWDSSAILQTFTSSAYGVVRTLVNVVIGFILAIYLLYSKSSLCAHMKRLCYAFFDNDKVDAALRTTREGHKIMSRFIIGKIIDSVIIGVLCFAVMLILRLPYALLVSAIVCVTNVIPSFGPFIGGIPSALLILLTDPMQGVIFIIMIFALQQIDGYLIGPKILGDRIGLSPFWVMFAIILGGGLFGFPGMVLGVPMLAIIFYIVREVSSRRLHQKEMPIDAGSYAAEGNYVAPAEDSSSDESV
ncbi:MAG: AI-2E family transporter [Clostridia bacterium]|nr:AI-2E family transporter [Clostridia bacterium]